MNTDPKLLRIGQLAQKAGEATAAVKHYLKGGLLPPPVKNQSEHGCLRRILRRLNRRSEMLNIIKPQSCSLYISICFTVKKLTAPGRQELLIRDPIVFSYLKRGHHHA